MKNGIVFIGWSKNQALAISVKNELNKYGYLGVVGGNWHENHTNMLLKSGSTIHATVTYQMSRCNQAILLFEKKCDENETTIPLSGNLLYETGYLTNKFLNANSKLHMFKINIAGGDDTLFPTDLQGVWGITLFKMDEETDELATKIVKEFCSRQIKIRENIILDINSDIDVDTELAVHTINPKMSDYELAKKLLFYTQSKYIFKEHENAIERCGKLIETLKLDGLYSRELMNTLDCALVSLDLFKQTVLSSNSSSCIRMEGSEFRRMLRRFREIAHKILEDGKSNLEDFSDVVFSKEDLRNDEVKVWAITQMQEHVTFLHLVYFDADNIDPAAKEKSCNCAIKYGETVVSNCGLLRDVTENYEYATLLLSYAYRNMTFFYNKLGMTDKSEENRRNSFSARENLYQQIQHMKGLKVSLREYFTLEYFVQLAEDIGMYEDNDIIIDSMDDMRKYIEFVEISEGSKMVVFNRFKKTFEGLTEKYQLVLLPNN